MRLLAAIVLSVALSESVIAQPAPRRDMPAAVRRVRDLARREYSGDSARAVVARMERWWGLRARSIAPPAEVGEDRSVRGSGTTPRFLATWSPNGPRSPCGD